MTDTVKDDVQTAPIVPSFGEENTGRKLAIICSKGSLDMAYPGLILANAALGEGVETHLFFTFWGFDMINKKTMGDLKFTPLGNTATHMPQGLGGLPGITHMATQEQVAEIEQFGTHRADHDVRELLAAALLRFRPIRRIAHMQHPAEPQSCLQKVWMVRQDAAIRLRRPGEVATPLEPRAIDEIDVLVLGVQRQTLVDRQLRPPVVVTDAVEGAEKRVPPRGEIARVRRGSDALPPEIGCVLQHPSEKRSRDLGMKRLTPVNGLAERRFCVQEDCGPGPLAGCSRIK